jgi:hypothetical protein
LLIRQGKRALSLSLEQYTGFVLGDFDRIGRSLRSIGDLFRNSLKPESRSLLSAIGHMIFSKTLVIYIEGIRLHRVRQARCGSRHPKVKPGILTTDEELDVWIGATRDEERGQGSNGSVKFK